MLTMPVYWFDILKSMLQSWYSQGKKNYNMTPICLLWLIPFIFNQHKIKLMCWNLFKVTYSSCITPHNTMQSEKEWQQRKLWCELLHYNKVSHHPKMAGNSLLGAHVFIYSFHLLGNQFSKIMFIFLRSTHIFKRFQNLWWHLPPLLLGVEIYRGT
jgi:hypothetical protein